MKDRNKVIQYLNTKFGWSMDLSVKWLDSPNWNFSGLTPNEVINNGNVNKVLYFLTTSN
jgi:hypothetical protein